jgi:uncharacterized repeat protein (TIGR01451 family)
MGVDKMPATRGTTASRLQMNTDSTSRPIVSGALRAGLGLLLAAATVLALVGCGGSREPSGNDLVVSGSASAASFVPGDTVVWTMTVQNIGNEAARDVRIVNQLGGFLVQTGFTCEASGGATCPASVGAVMAVPALEVGQVLTFRISAVVNAIIAGTISNTLGATAAEDIGRINNSATATATVEVNAASLGVTQDAEPSAAAGSAATFRVVISNPTGGTVVNQLALDWAVTAPFALDGITYTCIASGGAVCPPAQAPGPAMKFVVPTLGVGRSMNFTFSVPIPDTGRGTITSTAALGADGDLDTGNNQSTITTQAIDTRNGVYQAYSADGSIFTLTIDFDAGSYTWAGTGVGDSRSFSAEADGGFVTSRSERLRSVDDLIVGAHQRGSVSVPYVAARRFATSPNALAGAYNLMLRNVAADGSGAVTRAATARAIGNTLQICQDDFEVVQAQSCSVGSLKSYVVSFSGDQFTAVDSSSGQSFSFRLARTGAADVLLAAGAGTTADTTLQFLIGVAENAGLIDSAVAGPGLYANLDSEWVNIELTRTTYFAEGSKIADVAGLFRVGGTSPIGMLQGAPEPTLGGAPIWVMQSFPLVVVVGATKSAVDQANVSGLLQIAVP